MDASVAGGAVGDPNTVTPALGEHIVVKDALKPINADTFYDCPTVLGFDHWEGEGIVDPCAATTTVMMDQDKTVTVVFKDDRQCGDLCHPIVDSDITENCHVDLEDFVEMAADWLICTHPNCDAL